MDYALQFGTPQTLPEEKRKAIRLAADEISGYYCTEVNREIRIARLGAAIVILKDLVARTEEAYRHSKSASDEVDSKNVYRHFIQENARRTLKDLGFFLNGEFDAELVSGSKERIQS